MAEHQHQHDHDHDHGHGHAQAGDNQRRMLIALCLTGGFMVVEAVGGWLSGSLALLADAGHMLTDTASLALAWWAFRLGRRPPGDSHTYGLMRAEVLAAFVNGLALMVLTGWIVWEAVERLREPVPVAGGVVMMVAGAGLLVNIAAFKVLHGGHSENLNMKGAMLHVVGDLLGSVAALAAGLVIYLTGWRPIDPLLSVLVALLILRSAWFLTRRSAHVLLEGSPESPTPAEVKAALEDGVGPVLRVHHVHVWSLTPEHPLITLHAQVAPDCRRDQVLERVNLLLAERFGAHHNTVQLEKADCGAGEVCDGPWPACSPPHRHEH